jgi:RimJ/RimL family protein N-acetyltransferase
MTDAPRLETERLVLRPHRMEDFPPFAAFFAGDRARFVGGPLPLRRVWHGFASDVGSWALMGFGAWAIEEKATGDFAGQVGLNKPAYFPEREIGWILMPGFEGRGFATEAARTARVFAYDTLGWNTAVSYIDPENRRSIAVARRLGATEDERAERFDPKDLVFRHPAPEALQ